LVPQCTQTNVTYAKLRSKINAGSTWRNRTPRALPHSAGTIGGSTSDGTVPPASRPNNFTNRNGQPHDATILAHVDGSDVWHDSIFSYWLGVDDTTRRQTASSVINSRPRVSVSNLRPQLSNSAGPRISSLFLRVLVSPCT
jgi:hypothetical protein